MTIDRKTPGLPLEQLIFDQTKLPPRDRLTEAQRHGYECALCSAYTGGTAPVAGRIKVAEVVICLLCYRANAKPRAGVA